MWTDYITSISHVLKVNEYGERQAKVNEKSLCFKGWETLVKEFKILSFSASPKEVFPKEDLTILYGFLSSQSHPSFLGILQFGQMYNSDEYKERALMILNSICKFQQVIVRDFCNAFPKAKEFLDKMPKEQTKYLLQNEIREDGNIQDVF